MTLFRCEIHKQFNNGEKFANDYIFDAPDIGTAAALAQDWASLERALMISLVTFLDIRTSTVTVGDRVFIHTPLNFQGQSGGAIGDSLPGYCCLRLDLSTAQSDPGHKYYRYVVLESNQGGGIIDASSLSAILGVVNTHISNNPDMLADLRVGKNNHTATGVTLYPFVQERQEHRRRKKKATGTGV